MAGAGLWALPGSGARAATRRASRLLILSFTGGIRSAAAFHAAPPTAANWMQHNPWGIMKTTQPTDFALGKVLDDHLEAPDASVQSLVLPEHQAKLTSADYTLSNLWQGEVVPALRDVAHHMSVVGTWHATRGSHPVARIEESTGSTDGRQPGILTRIYAGLQSTLEPDVPGFHLEPYQLFGNAPGQFVRFGPISMRNARDLPSEDTLPASTLAAIGQDWTNGDEMHDWLDNPAVDGRSGHARQLAEGVRAHRSATRRVGGALAKPWMNVGNSADLYRQATFGKVRLPGKGVEVDLSNAMLDELFKMTLGQNQTDALRAQAPITDSATNSALAMRLLQLGSPAVCVEIPGYDSHGGEVTGGPPLYRYTGRLWATLHWLLANTRDPADPSKFMIDTTLVATTSDFGRDRGTAKLGFNGGEGSDHGNDPSCYYLAHALMGAGVKKGKLIGGAPTDTFDARKEDVRHSPRQFLATLMDAVGADASDEQSGFPDVQPIDAIWED